ncbi:MAG TPA: DNA adenine methylase [Gammaproteobacteria bacterium]|nr:DNA adenine methylase [Gammaproteobacteria bacterium]
MAARPLLRYFGGKWRLAPWIIEHFPPHRMYIEPFAGAASVLIRKPRARVEVLGDIDGGIVRLFRVLRDPAKAEQLLRLVELTPYSREEWDDTWSADTGDEIEDARRFILRSWASYGCSASTKRSATGFRRCTRGRNGGSHPAMDWSRWPDAARDIVDRLRGVVIEREDACDLVQRYDDPEALHYIDPPYVHDSRARPDHQYRHEMSDDDHRRLAQVLRECRGHVVVSGYRCDLYDDLFGGWPRYDKDSQVDGGRTKTESLWLAPHTAEAIPTQPLFLDREMEALI